MGGRDASYFAEKWKQEGRKSVLDFGCGKGEDTIVFVQQGFWVTAVDESEEHVSNLRRWEKKHNKIFRSKWSTLERLPFAENAFDCIWAYSNMRNISQTIFLQRVQQFQRVLKPNGVICLTIDEKERELWYAVFEKANFVIASEELCEPTSGDTAYLCMELMIKKETVPIDFSHVLGRKVRGKIDRPLGSWHSVYKSLYYPVNYGYVEGVLAGDGEEQDIYLLGEEKPVSEFCGTVVAVIHRLNDVEDKWVVDASDKLYSEEEIQKALDFQEKYFCSEIYVWKKQPVHRV